MSENIWEQALERYLAMDRGLFLNPQYLIGTPGEWEANPDFLAICFRDKTVWMVEVTARAVGLNHKIEQFAEYANRIWAQLIGHCVISEHCEDWQFGFWAFVPERNCKAVRARFKLAGIELSLATPLEETMKPSSWEMRIR
jgi:hypothetical protein